MADAKERLVNHKKINAQTALEVARRVLQAEIAALQDLSKTLNSQFIGAIDLIDKVDGRVIVTGMGKSGHIARKIASTLASTGTPSQYVHPGEASHGDLGMVTAKDAIIALSNSGETSELSDIVAFAKLQGIPLISITGEHENTLSRAADVSLFIPPSPEACPLNLAPTTSTTMMLALGDAIAVSLLDRGGFSSDDFGLLHPGGRLGTRLTKGVDIMRLGDEIPLVDVSTPMTETILEMTAKQLGCVGVVGVNGKLSGVITDGDLRRHMENDILTMTAAEVMTANPKTVDSDVLAAQVLGLMNDNKITSCFVVVSMKPVGIIHIHDVLRSGIS